MADNFEPSGERQSKELLRDHNGSDRNYSGGHSGRRRRRHRRKKETGRTDRMLRILGLAILCVLLVVIGVLLGLSYRSEMTRQQQYQAALQTQRTLHQRWVDECQTAGHSKWACNKFDSAHFEAAGQLDEFACELIKEKTYHCAYALNPARVVVVFSTPENVDGEIGEALEKTHVMITHSDANDPFHVSVSAKGRIEFNERNQATPRFVLNPSTGALNAVAPDTEDAAKE